MNKSKGSGGSKTGYFVSVRKAVLGIYPRRMHVTVVGPHELPEPIPFHREPPARPVCHGGGEWNEREDKTAAGGNHQPLCPIDTRNIYLEFQNLTTGQRVRTNLLQHILFPTSQSFGLTLSSGRDTLLLKLMLEDLDSRVDWHVCAKLLTSSSGGVGGVFGEEEQDFPHQILGSVVAVFSRLH